MIGWTSEKSHLVRVVADLIGFRRVDLQVMVQFDLQVMVQFDPWNVGA